MASALIHIIKKFILETVFPKQCLSCRKKDTLFCNGCLHALSFPERTRTAHISFILSAARYTNPPIRNAIRTMKYRSARTLTAVLGDFLALHLFELQPLLGHRVAVIPVPISGKRMRERGYNQARVLAERIAQTHHWNLCATALQKIKHTGTQTSFRTTRQRQKNVRDSFAINTNFLPHGRTILLVDDVATSNATLDECARVLKNAGARKVYGAVIARG